MVDFGKLDLLHITGCMVGGAFLGALISNLIGIGQIIGIIAGGALGVLLSIAPALQVNNDEKKD